MHRGSVPHLFFVFVFNKKTQRFYGKGVIRYTSKLSGYELTNMEVALMTLGTVLVFHV